MSCGVRRKRWQLAAGIHMVLNTCRATRSVPFIEAQISCGWTERLAGVSHVRVSIEPTSLEVENYLTPWDHPCILKSCTSGNPQSPGLGAVEIGQLGRPRWPEFKTDKKVSRRWKQIPQLKYSDFMAFNLWDSGTDV